CGPPQRGEPLPWPEDDEAVLREELRRGVGDEPRGAGAAHHQERRSVALRKARLADGEAHELGRDGDLVHEPVDGSLEMRRLQVRTALEEVARIDPAGVALGDRSE